MNWKSAATKVALQSPVKKQLRRYWLQVRQSIPDVPE